MEKSEVNALPGDILTATCEDARTVPERIANLVDVIRLQAMFAAPTDMEWCNLLEAEILKWIGDAVDAVGCRIKILAESAGFVPPLAQPDKFPTLDLVSRV